MDTISRENNNSYLPVAGVIVGVLALVFSTVAFLKVRTVSKQLADQDAKIVQIGDQVTTASGSVAGLQRDLKALNNGTQSAVEQLAGMLNDVRGSIAKIEESTKRPAPSKASAGPVVAGPDEYIVKAGDYGAKIAKAHGISLADLQAVNPGVDLGRVQIGQKLKLPAKK